MTPDPDRALNHFKFWKVTERPATQRVKLLGQFDNDKPTREKLDKAVWLGNPVKKDAHPIVNPAQHLVGYFIAQRETPAPIRKVVLKNQFHTEPVTWTIGDPAALLLPASKVHDGDPPPPPADLDHYECYLVRGAEAFSRNVTLEDQFDRKLGRPERITKLEPAFFAVPVSKNGGTILRPKLHLALYDITPRTPAGKEPLRVRTRDQFSTLRLTIEESIMLAVPTEKISWSLAEG